MEDSSYESIPKTENAKEFLDAVGKKYTKFSNNELLNTLHSTFYDETSGVRGHIDNILAYYNKIKTINREFDSNYVVWLIIGTLPSQFDNIRSSYNAHKEQWTIEEITTILAKEEEDMKKERSRSISVLTTQGGGGQKRKYPYNTAFNKKKYVKKQNTSAKGNSKNVPSTSNDPKNEGFKGKRNYCHKFGHKKTYCRKLKVVQENKGDDRLGK